MRMIDIALPKLGDDNAPPAQTPVHTILPSRPNGFRLPSGLFTSPSDEGFILDDQSSVAGDGSDRGDASSEYDAEVS